ncbi:hypothetical protein D7S86_16150 [Pararobbsia silviterrae]|uniref:Uncharacterized protein n=1 Tax=Pararobbsia silviterrae TaxID=1792498 RepID=A0A494Y0A6_9BURK|nr:hypothetical protein D7S86_16150 [Pararobbsia silviterrae]
MTHGHKHVGKEPVETHALPFRCHHQINTRRAFSTSLCRRLADPDGDVDAIALERDRLDRRMQPYLDVLMRLRELGKSRHQPRRRQRRQDAHDQAALHRARGQFSRGRLNRVEGVLDSAKQAQASLRQLDFSREPVE